MDRIVAPGDSYAQLPFDPARYSSTTLHGGSLTFFDIDPGVGDWGDVLSWLELVPLAVLARSTMLIVRWPRRLDSVAIPDALDQTSNRLIQRGMRLHVGAIEFSIGYPPRIHWQGNNAAEIEDGVVLQRARAAELRAFLDWGGAVLRPKGYHYILPSGHHARTFIRVAEALRADTRAARALSTWLLHGIHPERQTTVVLDTGSLSPLVSELNSAAEHTGNRLATTLMLDSYPVSRFEYRRLLGPAEGTWVLGILSVSSTGALRQNFQTTLVQTVGEGGYRLETLITRRSPEESRVVVMDQDGAGVHAPWVSVHDSSDIPQLPDSEQGCRTCQIDSLARLVRIDPTNMAAMVLPQPIRIVPKVVDGHRNRKLWEAYEEIAAEGSVPYSFHGPTGTRRHAPRLDGDANQVFFEPGTILARADASVLALARLLSNRVFV